MLKSKINLNVAGSNIYRFIKRLKNNNIEILNIDKFSDDKINITIYKKDYDKLLSLKTVYDIEVCNYNGFAKMQRSLINNKFIIISIFFALICLYVLTNMIFSIDVITNDSAMETKIRTELSNFGVKKYNFKKDYNSLQKIKTEILNKYRNELEWIEIENIGTKYIVRYEPRLTTDNVEDTPLRHIIAKKDAVITDLNISSGQIIKNLGSYVKKGDIIVSGYISLNESVKDTVSSSGTVYGETWYNVKITYPNRYYESYETGNEKKVFVINFLTKQIELFNFNKYKTKNIRDNILLKNNILPIYFSYQTQKETKVIDENNTEEELIKKAVNAAKTKIEEKLQSNEYIKNYKILNKTKNKNSITLNIFFSVIENITNYQEIDKYGENSDAENKNMIE